MARFSTHLLDAAIARRRAERERLRQEIVALALTALDELAKEIPFQEAYLFGSVARPYRFHPYSDVDIAFVGLPDEHFFRAMAFLSRKLGRAVDVVQLESVRWKDAIMRGGIRWKGNG